MKLMIIFALTRIALIAATILLGILMYQLSVPIFITVTLLLAAGILITLLVCVTSDIFILKHTTQKRQNSSKTYSEKQDMGGW